MADSPGARSQSIIIGVAGGTGSGKTTVASRIIERVGAHHIALIQHDAYYVDLGNLPLGERRQRNFDHPDALDTPLMISHLRALRSGQPVEIPTYDFTTYTRRSETKRLDPRKIIVVEGILIFVDRALRELMNIKIFVDADSDVRLLRRIKRDIIERQRTLDVVLDQYERTVRPMHLEFVEPSKRYADVIIPEGGHNLVALEMIVARIENMLDDVD
ncbi:MAG: uridine kinase [Chloroflexi bacterium]|nr:uridine kinase [Chloroflexota bacterium]